MKYKVYRLIYQSSVVYVGLTTVSLSRRKNGSYKGTCVESIIKDCDIELIEETNEPSRERYWIDYYKDTICNILAGNGVNKKEYLNSWEEKNKDKRKENREKKKEKKKEYDRQRYLKKKL
jgi:hypothetical protein